MDARKRLAGIDETREISSDAGNGIAIILSDAVEEINLLIDISNKQFIKMVEDHEKRSIQIAQLKSEVHVADIRNHIKREQNKEK